MNDSAFDIDNNKMILFLNLIEAKINFNYHLCFDFDFDFILNSRKIMNERFKTLGMCVCVCV